MRRRIRCLSWTFARSSIAYSFREPSLVRVRNKSRSSIQTIVRPFQLPDATIRTGKLAVNLEARVVSVDDHPMHVTGTEYAILELLSLRKGTILTRKCFLTASITE